MPDVYQKNVAVVTGSNKGIGFAIVKGLFANNYNGIVYLTARNVSRGEEAVRELNQLGYKPEFHQLDISDENSVQRFANHLKSTHGGIDLLINNAAIKYSSTSEVPYHTQIVETLKTNYYGTKCVCNHLFPLLRNNAQVINISSAAGHVSCIPDPIFRAKFTKGLTIEDLDTIIDEFIKLSKHLEWIKDWKHAGYVLSKVALCALTDVQQRYFDRELKQANICVNSVHPGYVCTDMTNQKGIQSADEGAKSTIFLALNKNHGFKAQFIWYDCSVADWTSDKRPKDIKP